MDSHTPTPWTVDEAGRIWTTDRPLVTGRYPKQIALCFKADDAAHIVQVVNVYPHMLKALKAVESLFGNETPPQMQPALYLVASALATLEEKS